MINLLKSNYKNGINTFNYILSIFKNESSLFFFFLYTFKSHYKWNFKNFIKLLFFIFFWIKIRVLYYLNNWVYTTNHKRIAVNYFWFVILSGIVGMVLATVIRLEFAYPGVGIFAGDSLQYLSLVTAHGVIMVFFMIMPLLLGAFANFLLPTQLGVHDVAFPRLNSAAFWFLPGGLLMLAQLVCVDRRYQRMNCFNIREIQSILKKRFYTDLIDSHQHTQLINKTTLNLKFKLNDVNLVDHNFFVFHNYGVEITQKKRLFSFNYANYFDKDLSFFNQNNIFFTIINKTKNLNLFFILNNFLIYFFFLINNYFNIFFFFNNLFFLFFFFINFLSSLSNFIFTNNLDKLLNFFNFNFVFYSFFSYIKFWICNISYNFFKIEKYNNYFSFLTDLDKYKNYFSVRNINLINFGILELFFFYNFKENFHYFWFFFSNFFFFFKSFFFNFFIFFNYLNKKTYATPSLEVSKNLSNFYLNENIFFEKRSNKHGVFTFNQNFTDLQTSNFFSARYNFNSHLIYFYIILHFLTQLPIFFFNFILNIFNFKEMSTLINNYNDLLTIWYIPLLVNDNIFYSFWYFIYNKILFNNNFFFFIKSKNFDYLHLYLLNLKLHILNFFNFLLPYSFTTLFNFFFILLNNFLIIVFNIKTFSIFEYFYSIFKNNFFLKKYKKFNYNLSNELNFKNFSNNKLSDQFLFNGEELFSNFRYQRFDNPIFKYDYKSGDYYPKLYKELYPYLFPSFIELTGGLRQSSWFFSPLYSETFLNNFNSYICNFNENKVHHSFASSKFFHTNSFFNFFFFLNSSSSLLNKRWVSFNTLDQKFYKFFHTSSMQQRIYSNWRSLKFTREAWRCKLLMARHQKTLFRRYVNEDGVFWSIERNAKDLLPGWAMITPFSSRTRFTAIGKTDIGLMGVLLVLNSSIISAANFLVTYRYLSTLNNRKMRDARSFFTEAIMVSSWMMVAANPMLVIGIIMLLSDRHWQTSFFDYSGGGDTVLFQHMFWFFGHPEVYIIILPTFGFTNTMISYYLKKRVSARASLLYSMYTIAFLGFFVWGHHMYMVGLAHTTRMLFSTLTVMISVPAATKLMHWCVTTVNSSFAMELPLVCTLTFIFLFVSGGISGMCVAHTGMDVLFHDTFYVIGHFHVMLAGAAMIASFGAFYFYFVAIFGVKYSRIYAYLHFTYYLLGQLFTVIPMFWLGYAGMPRRVLDYPSSFGGWHSVISGGHMLSVAGLIAFFIMIFDSLRQSKATIRNTFGIARYNTRLNFYIYEIAKINNVQEKSWTLFKFLKHNSIQLNKLNFYNFEHYETTLLSYTFSKKFI